MHVLIIGAAGMVGRKLASEIAKTNMLAGTTVDTLSLVDVIIPQVPEDFAGEVSVSSGDIADFAFVQKMIAVRPDVIFHLAAIVSGEAELDFEKGYAINLDGTRNLFDAIRLAGIEKNYCPRVIFTSSIAVFGSPFPEKISDDFVLAPRTSYGTQKAIGELLLADYSRRGIFDGIGIRLPTVCIRPGKPNKAASGFFSNILREPLVGLEAVLPVSDDVRHWHVSPRRAVGFMLHAAGLDLELLGNRPILNMPGISATVGEQIEALRRVAGDRATRLIKRQPDELIAKIVAGWPQDFDPSRAMSLGFVGDRSFDEIIQIHIDDELGGKL